MKDKEFGRHKIYKNANPSSIIDYVGGNIPRKSSLKINPHIINYPRNLPIIYQKSIIDKKTTLPKKINYLKPVLENYILDEELSSNGSNENKDNRPLFTYKNIFKQYKSVNTNFHNINNRIYNSTNKLYDFQGSKKNIINNKLFNSSSINNDINTDDFSNMYSPFKDEINSPISKITSEEEKSEFNLNRPSDLDMEKDKNNEEKKPKHKDFQEKAKDIKIKFYVLISSFYFSSYLLCLKITLKLSMPEIPSMGVSLFIISFNNLFISLLFMKLDQVNYPKLPKFKNGNFFLKIIINYLRILLVINSLQHLNLLTFILILNMFPIIISYISIRENNQSFKVTDSICYFIFIIICSTEFILQNKISMICTFALMIINTFIYLAKINEMKNIHSYVIDFGSSLIGIAISPLIMSINGDNLNISISQYLLFFIICFTYFLNHYFESKITRNTLGQGLKIISNVFIIILYILYSNFLLRENNHFNSYLLLGLSFLINLHSKLRIESSDI